jgi:cyclic beta-1,2-glucan synthetase
VISGASDQYRAGRAMASVDEYLVRRGDGLIVLFNPPFDRSSLDPGYIKGYVPGVRENGGQYTHAALWTVIAFAMLGDGDRAGELFGLLNPINHASTRAGMHKYKVEPYVAVGDVYAVPPHTAAAAGRGTPVSRLDVSSGPRIHTRIQVERRSPAPRSARAAFLAEFEITYRRGPTTYHIKIENPHALCRA